ncbi:hypothetical protein F5B20DRAFT_592050 [Whalleya microplaca]|nr:hypothetical protein F5B20DRAFT_592050 [Whalleya microplaca]
MDYSTLQTPKSGRSRFSKALPAPPSELDDKPETIPRKLPTSSYSPFPPRKDSVSIKTNTRESTSTLQKPVESPLPALTNIMESSNSQSQRNVIPRKPVGLPMRPAPTAAGKSKKLKRVSSISSILSAYSHTSSDSVQRSSQDSFFTKDSEPSYSPEREGVSDIQQRPSKTYSPYQPYQVSPSESEMVNVLDEIIANEPVPPPPPMKEPTRPTTPRRNGSPDVPKQEPQNTDPSSSPVSVTGNSPQKREIWRRRASSKSDRSLAVAELKLAVSHGSTASTSQTVKLDPLPLPPPIQSDTATAALPPRSASLPGRDIRPIRPDTLGNEEDMGKFSSVLKGLVKHSSSKEPVNKPAISELPELPQEPKSKVETKSEAHHVTTTSESPAPDTSTVVDQSGTSPNPAATSENPKYEANTNSIPRPPVGGVGGVPRLGLPQHPRPARSNPNLRSPSSFPPHDTAMSSLQDTQAASPSPNHFTTRSESMGSTTTVDARSKSPANSNEAGAKPEFYNLVTSLNQPQISPDSSGKRTILQPQPTRKISVDTHAVALSDIGESTEQMSDEEAARLNEGLALFPRDRELVPVRCSAEGIWAPKPLAAKHFACFNNHERWVTGKNVNYALACATCGTEDREPRRVCSFCYLRVCFSCQARLVQKYGGSLRALVDNMEEDRAELRRLEKRRDIPSLEVTEEAAVSRARSLRQPTSRAGDSDHKDGVSTRSQARATSPSRLPTKPLTRSATVTSATTSASTTSRIRPTGSAKTRPVSGTYGSKVSSARADNAANTTTTTTTKPPGRALSTRHPPLSSISTGSRTSSASTSRPRSSGGPTSAPAQRQIGHSRAKSTVTSLTAATTLRPRSSQPSPPSSGPGTPTSTSFPTNTSKPVTRSQTNHARAKSQSIASSQSSTTGPPPSQHHNAIAAPHRPAFNTNQQHYSPAKTLAPKPLTATFLAPPSPSKLPTNVAISAETARLQTELLQLSLLHRDAAAVDAEWHASARTHLESRFARLATETDALADAERAGVEARNVAALARWGQDGNGRGLEPKLQVLDQVLNGVWSLGEPGGRYERVVRGFEAWAEQMSAIVAAQRGGDVGALVKEGNEDVRFVSELDRGWMVDCAVLVRKLEAWRVLLRELGEDHNDNGNGKDGGGGGGSGGEGSEDGSGLARMLRGARALVHDMLAELGVMGQIERDAAAAEDAWTQAMNAEMLLEEREEDTPARRRRRDAPPLWKMAV